MLTTEEKTIARKIKDEIEQLILQDKLILPTLPEIALRVREAIEDPDASLESVAEIIQQDISLTARLIRIANSPMMRSAKVIDTLMQALSRLGLNFVQNITVGIAMEQLFQATHEIIDNFLHDTWHESLQLATVSGILAKQFTQLPADKVSLAGFIHKIGELPILTYLEEHDDIINHRKIIEHILEELHPQIGYLILKMWDFPKDLICIPLEAQNIHRTLETTKPDYADVLVVAKIQLMKMYQSEDFALISDTISNVSAFTRMNLPCDYFLFDDEELTQQFSEIKAIYR